MLILDQFGTIFLPVKMHNQLLHTITEPEALSIRKYIPTVFGSQNIPMMGPMVITTFRLLVGVKQIICEMIICQIIASWCKTALRERTDGGIPLLA